ncbi:MAG: HAD-IA family hydrolase [Anaerolineae bacterium]|nr:HAD-IA family hydrolase [Anaerolineae bacterium]
MATRALIFDRDGVLTYFELVEAAAFFRPLLPISIWEMAREWQAFGEEQGFPTSVDHERSFFADFWDRERVRHNLSPAQYEALLTLDYTRFVRAFPDSQPALRHARQAGYRIGVLSNFSLASLDASLHAAGLADDIDTACAATVIGASKPARPAYEQIAAALGVEPEACLFFDDEPLCVEGARAAGMCAYLVDRHRQESDLAGNVIHSLAMLPALLTPR